MNTRALMAASALFMGLLGVAASFLPQEIAARFGMWHAGATVLGIQIAGALYLGFAVLNWMARANLIGGIYSRPVALGNFLHFAVVTVVLLKAWMSGHRAPELVAGLVIYAAFALAFGSVLFTHPLREKKD